VPALIAVGGRVIAKKEIRGIGRRAADPFTWAHRAIASHSLDFFNVYLTVLAKRNHNSTAPVNVTKPLVPRAPHGAYSWLFADAMKKFRQQ
jgi:hypothetical protein